MTGAARGCRAAATRPPIEPARKVRCVPTPEEVRRQHEQELLGRPYVQGVSAERIDGEDVLVVLVSRPPVAGEQPVPERLGGYRVVVTDIGGEISAQGH
jgi:hypothetical protein